MILEYYLYNPNTWEAGPIPIYDLEAANIVKVYSSVKL